MYKLLKLFVGMLFIFALTGCFGEDYDVGVPTALLQLEIGLQDQQTQLTEANISWSSTSGDVEKTIDNIEEFGLSQDKIKVSQNQDASLEFKENEENGGDIWTDPTVTATLWKNGEQIDIELNDNREFQFPTNEGTYVLEVKFIDSANSAQYVGNIVIDKSSGQTKITDGKLPEFTLMEIPSIKKVNSVGADGVVFDNSYSEVCWNNCSDNSAYNYPDIHSGDVEIGDDILIDWHKMKPHPTKINLLQINTDNYEVIKKVNIDITNTPLEIEVDEENIDAQYALEFLWKEGNKINGRTMLNFRLE
ncbi:MULTISPECIES: hypothetical protein [Metabacillus]|uniref:Uncharacterized protein n=1 Tax=Metabacillus elymi TaxID=2745198 RepID=A0ABX6S8H9_9BACI|nr:MULTISPECIES: hypothetical protein [Metabacillus]QNF29893.1 hypothetical protein HUW50_21825 [Metabacillus sp. KUDC1714]